MRRFASTGIALALLIGTLVPVASAQGTGKTLVMGFSQEPDTFVAGEGGLYVTNVASNMVYSSLVIIDDLMRPLPDLAVEVPTLDNGDAVMVGDGADQHLETTFRLKQNATFSDGTVADHDRVAVIERRYVDCQVGLGPHQVVNDDQRAVHHVGGDVGHVQATFACNERIGFLRETHDKCFAGPLGACNRHQRADR